MFTETDHMIFYIKIMIHSTGMYEFLLYERIIKVRPGMDTTAIYTESNVHSAVSDVFMLIDQTKMKQSLVCIGLCGTM